MQHNKQILQVYLPVQVMLQPPLLQFTSRMPCLPCRITFSNVRPRTRAALHNGMLCLSHLRICIRGLPGSPMGWKGSISPLSHCRAVSHMHMGRPCHSLWEETSLFQLQHSRGVSYGYISDEVAARSTANMHDLSTGCQQQVCEAWENNYTCGPQCFRSFTVMWVLGCSRFLHAGC